MMRDKMALLTGIGPTHHRVSIRLCPMGLKLSYGLFKLCTAIYLFHGMLCRYKYPIVQVAKQ